MDDCLEFLECHGAQHPRHRASRGCARLRERKSAPLHYHCRFLSRSRHKFLSFCNVAGYLVTPERFSHH